MKELSIEEKAKRYDEAIERAKIWQEHLYDVNDKDYADELNYIFPELKEGEDEKTKRILYSISSKISFYLRDIFTEEEFQCFDAWSNAWLKKQEQKPDDKAKPKFKVGQTIKKECFNLGFNIVKIEDGFYYNNTGDHFPFTDQDNWELVDQEPAWSEKEEQTFIKSVEALEDFGKFELADWLKEHKNQFLKPQDRWKLSGEQMYYLKRVQEGIFNLKVLESLYNDLRKLEG